MKMEIWVSLDYSGPKWKGVIEGIGSKSANLLVKENSLSQSNSSANITSVVSVLGELLRTLWLPVCDLQRQTGIFCAHTSVYVWEEKGLCDSLRLVICLNVGLQHCALQGLIVTARLDSLWVMLLSIRPWCRPQPCRLNTSFFRAVEWGHVWRAHPAEINWIMLNLITLFQFHFYAFFSQWGK